MENSLSVKVGKEILHSNKEKAAAINKFLKEENIKSFNMMSSPGSGKTTLLERTIEKMGPQKIAVIEGDLETENDAKRIREKGALSYQITTGTTCHLDASMVEKAIGKMDLTGIEYLFVENVGNLVCPANFHVGTDLNVVLLSATEGDDKPVKYPVMFHVADVVLITKIEAAQIMNFSMEKAMENIKKVNPKIPIFTHSINVPDDFEKWLEFIKNA